MYNTFNVSLYNLKEGFTADFAKKAESEINRKELAYANGSKAGLVSRVKKECRIHSPLVSMDSKFNLTDASIDESKIIFKFDIIKYKPDVKFNVVLLYLKQQKAHTPVLIKFVDVKLNEKSKSIEICVNINHLPKEAVDIIRNEINGETK